MAIPLLFFSLFVDGRKLITRVLTVVIGLILIPSVADAQRTEAEELAWRTKAKTVQVSDEGSGLPIQNATIASVQPRNLFPENGGKWGATTNAKGEFVLNDWWTDADTFRIEAAGYVPQTLSIAQLRGQGYQVLLRRNDENGFKLKSGINPIDLLENVPEKGMASSTAELLRLGGEAYIQNSYQNAGSPIIRGMEGSRINVSLLGVSLSHPGMSGRHQGYLMLIDPFSLDYADISEGSAQIYGAAVLGGQMGLGIMPPTSAAEGGKPISGRVIARAGTSALDAAGHVRLDYSKGKWAGSTMVTATSIGDVQGGEKATGGLSALGAQPFIAGITDQGQDTLLVNSRPYTAQGSACKALYVTQQIVRDYGDASNMRHQITLQYAGVPEVQLQHLSASATNEADTALAYADAFASPLQRGMINYSLFIRPDTRKVFDFAYLRLSGQIQDESASMRHFGDSLQRTTHEQWRGLQEDFRFYRMVRRGFFWMGVAANRWSGKSALDLVNVRQDVGVLLKGDGPYPSEQASTLQLLPYVGFQRRFGERLFLMLDIKYQMYWMKGESSDAQVAQQWPSTFGSSQQALTGSATLSCELSEGLQLSARYAPGAYFANFHDQFQSPSQEQLLPQLPSDDVKPEYMHQADLALQWVPSPQLNAEVTGWMGWHRRGLVAQNLTGLPGDDANAFLSLTNGMSANLAGVRAALQYKVGRAFTFHGTVHFTRGVVKSPSLWVGPAAHVPPMYGRVGLNYQKRRLGVWAFLLLSGWKRAEMYSVTEEEELQFAVNPGNPAFVVPHLGMSYRMSTGFTAMAGIDNPMDQQYRYYASAISQRGRAAWICLKKEF